MSATAVLAAGELQQHLQTPLCGMLSAPQGGDQWCPASASAELLAWSKMVSRLQHVRAICRNMLIEACSSGC
jgi:hypothetical protein